ncbi:MAG TPA: zinc ribbon domain-containing protein [Thermoanaerobaculia bacterium]
MAIREGAWDCPACGRKGNRGPEKFCGGCGNPRGPEVKFYLPEDAAEVTDAAALEQAKTAPDWHCPYCDADNRDANAFCSGCGAPRDGAATRQVVEHRFDAPPPPPPQPLKPQEPGKGALFKKGCAIGCLGLVLLVALFAWLGRPKSKDLTVTGHHWLRSIQVEELRPVQEQAWEGEVPSGARTLSSSREVFRVNKIQIGTETRTRTVSERVQTGTERVKVGTRDLGNGYFEDVYEDRPVYETQEREETYEEPVYREEPVYKKRYRYEIDKWVEDREAKAEGEDLLPAWPDPELDKNEREGTKKEEYTVLFQDSDGEAARYKAPNEQTWRSFEPGRSYKGKVKSDGEVTEIDSSPNG